MPCHCLYARPFLSSDELCLRICSAASSLYERACSPSQRNHCLRQPYCGHVSSALAAYDVQPSFPCCTAMVTRPSSSQASDNASLAHPSSAGALVSCAGTAHVYAHRRRAAGRESCALYIIRKAHRRWTALAWAAYGIARQFICGEDYIGVCYGVAYDDGAKDSDAGGDEV